VSEVREIKVTNDVGLHARPAAVFVKTAAGFSADVRLQNLTRESPTVNAKSILSVLSAGVEQNHRIRLTADGEDAHEALEALCALIESNFKQAEA